MRQQAGRIIPAMATTTAMVSGLVGLELMKIATEKARLREKRTDEKTAFSSFAAPVASSLSSNVRTRHGIRFAFGDKLKSFFSKKIPNQSQSESIGGMHLERQRILGRFRNSYVNLDGPEIAHAEPSAAEEILINSNDVGQDIPNGGGQEKSFTLWDTIQVCNYLTTN